MLAQNNCMQDILSDRFNQPDFWGLLAQGLCELRKDGFTPAFVPPRSPSYLGSCFNSWDRLEIPEGCPNLYLAACGFATTAVNSQSPTALQPCLFPWQHSMCVLLGWGLLSGMVQGQLHQHCVMQDSLCQGNSLGATLATCMVPFCQEGQLWKVCSSEWTGSSIHYSVKKS